MLLFYSSYGDLEGIQNLIKDAQKEGKFNVAFEAAFQIGQADQCVEILVKSKRIAEAAQFAKAYCPSKLPELIKEWSTDLKKKGF